MKKKESVSKKVVKKKKKVGKAKKHPNKSESTKKYRGQGK
jgi:hypothetical protein